MTRPAIFLAGCALCVMACGCSTYDDAYWRGYLAGHLDASRQAEAANDSLWAHGYFVYTDSAYFTQRFIGPPTDSTAYDGGVRDTTEAIQCW